MVCKLCNQQRGKRTDENKYQSPRLKSKFWQQYSSLFLLFSLAHEQEPCECSSGKKRRSAHWLFRRKRCRNRTFRLPSTELEKLYYLADEMNVRVTVMIRDWILEGLNMETTLSNNNCRSGIGAKGSDVKGVWLLLKRCSSSPSASLHRS